MSGDDVPTVEVDAEAIPKELKQRDQWLLWDARNEKPKQPHWNGNHGISWSDPDDWHSFDEAVKAAESRESWGIGYVCAAGNDDYARGVFGVIDIDGGADSDESPRDWVPSLSPFVERGAYVEWSVSHGLPEEYRDGDGFGLHVPVAFGANLPEWWKDVEFSDREHQGVDLLANKFCAFTGDAMRGSGAEVVDAGDWLADWLADAYEAVTGDEAPRGQETALDEFESGSGGSGAESGSYDGGEWFDESVAEDALGHIDPDVKYPTWRNIGFALASEFNTATAKRLYKNWSRHGSKWDDDAEKQADRIVDEADEHGGVTVATLVYLASEAGWTPPTSSGGPPEWKETVVKNSERYDSVDEVPDDPIDLETGSAESSEQPATADGGTAASAWEDADPPDYASELTQDALKIVAEVDHDESIGDLDDREKAAAVWELCRRSNEVHVRVRRDNGSLWAYDDGIWSEEGDRALRHAARQALGARNYGNNVLEELKAQARADPVVEIERGDFGVGAEKIAVANGLLDLEAAADGGDALRDLRPGDYALSQLPVEYDPDASADRWRQFIDEVVESRKIDAVQEYVGYCLDRSGLPHQKALLLVGSGSNGKSTFLNTVKKLLGSENVANTPLHKFEDDDRVAGLYGKLANIDADLSDASLSRDGVSQFKRLTGDDPVEGRHLYEDAFQFDPVSKHLYAANQVPDVSGIVDDTESAFWRRWIIVNFPVYIRKVDRDDTLAETLADELSGILNWAIEGYHRLKGQGYFTDVETEAETRRLWKSWGESADEFIVEHVERDDSLGPDDRLTTSDLWQVYKKWCTRTDRDASGQRAFTLKVKKSDTDFGYGQSVRVSHADSKTPAGYKHLKVSDDLRNLVEEVLDDSDDDRDDGQSSLV